MSIAFFYGRCEAAGLGLYSNFQSIGKLRVTYLAGEETVESQAEAPHIFLHRSHAMFYL
jgi:hypothetical protein